MFRRIILISSLIIISLNAMENPEAELRVAQKEMFQAVIENNGPRLLSLLLQGVNPNFTLPEYSNHSPLFYATSPNLNVEIVKMLLENGANPNSDKVLPYLIGTTFASPIALEDPRHPANKQNQIITLLLNHPQIDINQNYNGTALHAAINAKRDELIPLILAKPNLNINAVDTRGWTALMLAVMASPIERARKIAYMLLEHPNIDVNQTDPAGYTALNKARRRKTLYDLLRVKNALTKEELESKKRGAPEPEEQQKTKKAYMPYTGPQFQTFRFNVPPPQPFSAKPAPSTPQTQAPFYIPMPHFTQPMESPNELLLNALKAKNIEQLREALIKRANPNIRDSNGYPALMLAVAAGAEFVYLLLQDERIDPNITTLPEGNTPLMFAANNHHISTITFLLSHPRINVDLLNAKRQSALDFASLKKDLPTFTQLQKMILEKSKQAEAKISSAPSTRPQLNPEVYRMLHIRSDATPHQILQIEPTANEDEVRKAWRKLTIIWHPDRNPDLPLAKEVIQLINWAYERIIRK